MPWFVKSSLPLRNGMDNVHVDALLSAMLGGGLTTILAKAFITRALSELEDVVQKINEIKTQLAAITVKLELIERDRDEIFKHARKLAALENQVYRGPRKEQSCADTN